ncbi:hypothetical protein [Flaviaesturariibacter amylovorans]|uniref:hypothetical protein n=1 Tax=Flaviaesturariibacter amylovorans TaxID=1084520 RepID=UPI0031EB0BE0
MDMQHQSGGEKRKRKPLTKPVLVYSVKTGQTPCHIYDRANRSIGAPIWKARA